MNNFKFEFGRPRTITYSDEEILNELEKVAKHFNYNHFCRKDFDKIADIHSATIERRYNGSWSAAMRALKKRLEQNNIMLTPSRRRNIPEKAMFEEMERIWMRLGHRPSRNEWTVSKPKISYDSIYRHFKGWTNACLKFIEYKSGGVISDENDGGLENKEQDKRTSTNKKQKTKNRDAQKKPLRNRTISLNVRIKVLSRDNFRCVFCGKSPATNLGTRLHIDHKVPFSKGGKSTIDNLQTLCQNCNLGKSNNEIIVSRANNG